MMKLDFIYEALLWLLQFFLFSDIIHIYCDRRNAIARFPQRLSLAFGMTLCELILTKIPSSFGFFLFYFGSMIMVFLLCSLVLRSSYLIIASVSVLLIMMRTALIPITEKITIAVLNLSHHGLTGNAYLLSEVIGTCVMAVALLLIARLSKRTNYELPQRVQFIILLNVSTFAGLIISHFSSLVLAIRTYRFFILVFLLICFYLLFINYSTVSYGQQLENEAQLKYLQYEKQFQRELLGSYNELRKLRHDFKNHVFYMSTLLKSQHYKELESYFDTLSETVYQNTSQASTGHRMCNLILEQKRLVAVEQGIKLNLNCQIPPVLNISDMDLVSFLSNILDNAIEASAFVESPEINVDICRKNADMYFKISNRYNSKYSGIKKGRKTSKADTANHGVGLTILKDIVKRYDGSISFVQESDVFTVLSYMKI